MSSSKLKNLIYLCGPLSLVALILLDVIGGLNYPGYHWVSDSIRVLTAADSYSYSISIVFTIVYSVLGVLCCIGIWFLFKNLKVNKILKSGISLFVIGLVVLAVAVCIFNLPKGENVKEMIDNSKQVTKVETIETPSQVEQDSSLDSSLDSSDASLSDSSVENSLETTEKTVIDEEATAQNYQRLGEIVSQPSVTGFLISFALAVLITVVAFILSFVGGFKYKGILYFGICSIVCLTLLAYGIISSLFLTDEIFGISERFIYYSIFLYLSLIGGWAFVTNE